MSGATSDSRAARSPAAGHATGSSLWLVPDEACRARYRACIAALGGRLRTPRFEPHVTLLGGLGDSPEQVDAAARAVAAGTPPLELRFLRPGHREAYFRAFYLEVERSRELLAAHERAATLLRRDPDPDYLPHLSLVYGRLDEATTTALAGELGGAQEPCRATRLETVHTEGPPAQWNVLASYELG